MQRESSGCGHFALVVSPVQCTRLYMCTILRYYHEQGGSGSVCVYTNFDCHGGAEGIKWVWSLCPSSVLSKMNTLIHVHVYNVYYH